MNTVNECLSGLGAYLRIKAYGWALIRTGRLSDLSTYLKKKQKNKNKKRVRQVNCSQKLQNFFQNSFKN